MSKTGNATWSRIQTMQYGGDKTVSEGIQCRCMGDQRIPCVCGSGCARWTAGLSDDREPFSGNQRRAGESADSVIFFPIAFAGLMPAGELLKMMAVQAVLKTVYEILVLPVTVRVVKYMKRVTGNDAFDSDISYNILKINEL